MRYSWLMVLVLTGCTLADWSFHVGASQGTGSLTHDRQFNDFNSDVATVHVGTTYSPGVGARHDEHMGALRRVEYAAAKGEVADDEESLAEAFTKTPDDINEALILLISAGALVLLAVAWKLGLPFLKKTPDTEEQPE